MNRLVKQTTLMDIPYLEAMPSGENLKKYSLIVDAIFGFSFKPPIREPFDSIIRVLIESSSEIPIFSIDIPSGKFYTFVIILFSLR